MKQWVIIFGLVGILAGCSMRPKSFEGVSHAKPQIVVSLIGKSQKDIYKKFGEPALSRVEKSTLLWSYQADSCALLVYFDETNICRHAETRGKCQ